MRDDSALDQLAADLLQARDAARLTMLPSRREVGFDLDKGYQVGHVLHERLMERGYRSVGRKLAFTNPATWEEFNVDTPIWAHMYAQTVRFADRGSFRLSLGGMAAPRIEPEVVLNLRRPVPAGNPSAEELAGCLDWVAIGFEIVDCHYPDWRFTAADTVADFGVHAALVVAPPWRLDRDDPRQVAAQLQKLRVTLCRGTEIVAVGEGRNALGSPLLALGHLARVIVGQSWAPPLTPGEIITTGTLTPLPPVSSGERWSVDVAGAPIAPLQLELCD
ncbi:MAG: 2-keto-4-pentenoate hydratase [Candidatus Methylomirabilales bacterium]